MLRTFFIVAVIASLAIASSAFAVDAPTTVHSGGLSCFSINPPDAPTNKPGPHTVPEYRSCDQLCADRHAACTAATSNMNPMRSCASTDYFPGGSTLCRCCTVAQ